MQIPVKFESDQNTPLQKQLFDQLIGMIQGGQLNPGTRLPSTRALSEQLSVSRNTVINTYEELISQGYLISKPAAGTFVCESLPENALIFQGEKEYHLADKLATKPCRVVSFECNDSGVFQKKLPRLRYDFRPACADPQLFPTKIWRRLANGRLSYCANAMTSYGDPAGLLDLRKAIAHHIGLSRGIATNADQIIIVTGRQQGLNIVTTLLAEPGGEIVTERPCYRGAYFHFKNACAKLTSAPVDGQGIEAQKLPQRQVQFVYVTPSHQTFFGTTMSFERRKELVAWASKYGSYIVEDDFDGDFRYEGSPQPALKALDVGGNVVNIGSFSTSIGPGLRLGYVVLPRNLVAPARTIKALLDNGSSWLDQAILADFIEHGSFANHLKQIRQTYMIRRNSLVDALKSQFGDVVLSGLSGGMHLTWKLPDDYPSAGFLTKELSKQRIGVYTFSGRDLNVCDLPKDFDRYLLLGYAAMSDSKIEQGVAELSKIIRPR